MDETWIKDKEIKILEALATYKYLVPYQLVKLGTIGHPKTVERYLKSMREQSKPLIKFKRWGWERGIGNRHTFYTLTARGAEVLAEYHECPVAEIDYPKGKLSFENDYFHRLNTIDTQIAIRQWAAHSGAQIELFDTYLNSTGSQRQNRAGTNGKLQNKTRTDYRDGFFVPDGVCLLEHGGKRRLMGIEIHNRNKTYRILEQLQTHMASLEESALSIAYGHDKANFVLSVFEEEGTMRSTIKAFRQAEDFANFIQLFHFATVDGVREDIKNAWIDGNGQPVKIIFS